MKNFLYTLSLLAACSADAQAHRAWLLPSETIVAGDSPWVTFDLAVSNDIFQSDHAPLRTESVQVLTPDGKNDSVKNLNTGQLRTTFDVNLNQAGTYKIAVVTDTLGARWETADGKRAFWPERGAKPDLEDFEKVVPKQAKNLEVTQTSRRIETFVTKGAPSVFALQPTNHGFELAPLTHPNDLLVNEPSEFAFLIDGRPAAGAKIIIIADGSRYRSSPGDMELEADKKGRVSVNWPRPGIYWLGATYRDEKAQKPAKFRQGNYSATFEVLP